MDTGQASSGTVAGKRNRRRTERYPAAVRCTAQRRDGQPCGRLATRGTHVCATHGAQLPVVREAAARAVQEARLRLKLLHDPAVDTLTELLGDRDPRVRLGAVALLHKVSPLDAPAGGGGWQEDQPQQLRPAEVVRAKLAELNANRERGEHLALTIGQRAEEIVDAELV